MHDRLSPGERIQRLAEIGQLGDQASARRAAVVSRVDVEDIVSVLAQVAHDPRAALAAATGDDDPHCRPPRGKYDGGRVGPVPRKPSCSQTRLIRGSHGSAMIDSAMPARTPGPVPLPRRWSVGAARDRGRAGRQRRPHPRHVAPPRRARPALDARRQLTAIGQLTALFGTYLALVQLVLMSRSPWLDQVFGMDGLAVAHRWLGFATVWLLLGHGVFTTVGYALGDRSNVVEEFVTLITTYPYVLMATVSGVLFAAVAISSMRAARRRLSYETWYGIHLYAYLAIALGFLHQLFVGTDFIDDPVAVAYWVLLYVVTIALILVFRVGQPVWLSVRHRLRVSQHRPRGPGRRLDLHDRTRPRPARRPLRPVLRLAVPDPRRLVACPSVLDLVGTQRILAADHDQGARRLVGVAGQRVPVGTRVFVEGPYGVLTGARRTRPKVLLVAGGIGITPLRALLEALPAKPRRPDPRLPRRRRDADRLPLRARDARPRPRGDGPLPRRLAPARGRRSPRRGRPRAARAGCPRPRRLRLRTRRDDAAGRGEPARPGPVARPDPRRAVRVLSGPVGFSEPSKNRGAPCRDEVVTRPRGSPCQRVAQRRRTR